MKVRVVVGFTLRTGETLAKGEIVEVTDEAYATRLIERGRVEALGDKPSASKRKPRADKASRKK